MRFHFFLIFLVALFAISLTACGGGSGEGYYEDEYYEDDCGCYEPPPPPPCNYCEPPQPLPLNEVEIWVEIYLGEGAPCDFPAWVVCGSENTPEDYDYDADYICEVGLDWGGDEQGIHRRGESTKFIAYATSSNNAWVEIWGLGTNDVGYYLGLFEVVNGEVFVDFSQSQDVVGWIDTLTGDESPDFLSMPYTDELFDDLFDWEAWEVISGL